MASLFRSTGSSRILRELCASCSRGQVVVRPARFLTTSPRRFADVKPGPPLSQTNRAEITLRRFWKTVHIQEEANGDFIITLDKRTLKTPGGAKLVIPRNRRLLALLIANEWENQEEVLKQHALPVTSLASRAIDGIGQAEIKAGVIDALMNYLETDTICFPDEKPDALVRMQKQYWDPLFAWMKETYGVTLNVAEGLSPAVQSEDTQAKLRNIIEEMDQWELAAFERAVYATKSFIVALALCKGRITANEAANASHVEVRAQIEYWGEVEDTHDVDHQDIRRALGSVACLLVKA